MPSQSTPQTPSEFFKLEAFAHIYSPTEVLVNLALAFVLSMMIAYTYRATHRSLSYSQGFLLTLVLVGVITGMVMMVIGNNLARAFALVGALSIIRFRTVVKDPKDIAYVFFALAVGLASGTSSYFIASAGTLFVCAIAFVLDQTNFGSLYKSEFILRFRAIPERAESYRSAIEPFVSASHLIHVQPSANRETNQLTLDIVMRKDVDPSALTAALADVEGVSDVVLIASAKDADY